MSGKVRYIDWSPDEWIAGTFGVLTGPETAVYAVVLNAIYSRGDACPNDVGYIHSAFKPSVRGNRHHRWPRSTTADALAGLVELGKLRVSVDGEWLTNGRADRVLNSARERIDGAARAGIASGAARRARASRRATDAPRMRQPRANSDNGELSNSNGLARTGVRNHQPSHDLTDQKIITEAARDPPRDAGAPGRAPAQPEPDKLPKRAYPTTADRVAELARLRREQIAATQEAGTSPPTKRRQQLAELAAEHRKKKH